MFKRILSLLFCLCLIFAAGCQNTTVYDDLSDYESDVSIADAPVLAVNPLTGVADLSDASVANRRPVAIMVNNVGVAQKVQTGLSKADIIYETEVEGGITRLMAVYQDITGLDKIGTVRSARYPYVDLALGHNAIYIHCGQDPTYCAPHLKDINHLSIDTKSKGAQRIANGLPSEHTLYAVAGDLWENISATFDVNNTNPTPWASFSTDPVTLDGGAATTINVDFPQKDTNFTYDATTGLYTRLSDGNQLTDYYTQETTTVKNVFVLMTSITNYPDGKHRKVELSGGDGFYFTNGTAKAIKWSKGGANAPIKFTDTNGAELQISAGNSWVCIPNSATSNTTFQ
ncbi:MAG: DUF3048 domain-containing protein [Clostridia bacterium]|nr:DUF3048 domain-containing protein [Clostridia bacterium]